MVDEAFALVYPELSSKLVEEFPLTPPHTTKGTENPRPYLSYPLQTINIESLIESLIEAPNRDPVGGPPRESSDMNILVTTPAIAQVFPKQMLGSKTIGINLLVPADSFLSIEWDSEWAYHEMGLIAGYRLASLQKDKDPGASAAILFSRGIGRSQSELDAFAQAFMEGLQRGGDGGLGSAQAAETLFVFDVDSMNLPGDRLEQTLSALRQVEEKNPRLLMLASGSRLALESVARKENIDIMADIRGLGSDLSTKNLFAAVGENTPALISAISRLSQNIEKGEIVADSMRVKPELILSREARRIQAIVDAASPPTTAR
ncbi:MAG TPA: hypothetical protein DDZ37_00675 [Spirochaetaceae bacterium]|nr:hypothetical protein [Spirochaetaceae bacterium]